MALYYIVIIILLFINHKATYKIKNTVQRRLPNWLLQDSLHQTYN